MFSITKKFLGNCIHNFYKGSQTSQLIKKLSKNLTFTCVDVGCAGGFDPFLDRLPNQDLIKFYGYEPNKNEFEKLKKLKNLPQNYEFHNIAISNSTGQKNFFSNSTVSSIHERQDRELRFGEKFEKQIVSCSTLIDCRESNSITDDIDILKIDTEGSEIDVLNGAGYLLDKEVICIKLEFGFASKSGTNKFSEIDDLLTQKGFRLMAITINKTQNGALSGGDCLYFFDPSIKSKRVISETLLKKLAIISYSFGFIDFCSILPIFADSFLNWEFLKDIRNLATSKIYLPRLMPFYSLKLSYFFSLISILLIGKKSGSKNAPSSNRLLPFKYLYINTFTPFLRKIRINHISERVKNAKLLFSLRK